MPEAFTRAQALRAVGLTDKQVKQWERSGLVDPLPGYAFSDLAALRTLARLKSKKLPPLENLSVHLSGEEPFAARWTLMPAEQGDQIRITVIGERGRVVLAQSSGLTPSATLKVAQGGDALPVTTEFVPFAKFEN